MRRFIFTLVVFQIFILCAAGQTVKLTVRTGPRWIHKFKVMPLLTVKTRPQMAFWAVGESGEMETYFVTEKFAKASWRGAPGDTSEKRRPSALPFFTHMMGKGSPVLPTRSSPLPDVVTYATPKDGFVRSFSSKFNGRAVFYFEVNQSLDFNEFYSKEAVPGSPGYSGGKSGSGQPALIYKADLDLSRPGKYPLILSGCSSADGSHGRMDADLERITDADNIVGDVTVEIIQETGF